MKHVLFLFIFIFGCGALQAETPTKVNTKELKQEVDQIIKETPPAVDANGETGIDKLPSPSQVIENQASEIEKQAEKMEKSYQEAEKQGLPTPKHLSCLDLSLEEQTFANNLTYENQKAYCKKFTPDQRKTAIRMVGKPDSQGKILEPNDAIALVAKENSIFIPAPTAPATAAPKVAPKVQPPQPEKAQ